MLNVDQPPNIPQRPMGSIPVVVRLVRPDGEEWWPGTANRWTDTHVLVHWSRTTTRHKPTGTSWRGSASRTSADSSRPRELCPVWLDATDIKRR